MYRTSPQYTPSKATITVGTCTCTLYSVSTLEQKTQTMCTYKDMYKYSCIVYAVLYSVLITWVGMCGITVYMYMYSMWLMIISL